MQGLDEKLRTLDPVRAQHLETLVREAMERVKQDDEAAPYLGWPAGYFETTAGALADEEFERPPQGDFPCRDDW